MLYRKATPIVEDTLEMGCVDEEAANKVINALTDLKINLSGKLLNCQFYLYDLFTSSINSIYLTLFL